MAKLEVTKIEEQRDRRLLFNVRIYAAVGRIDFSIGIQDLGSSALNDAAVLQSALGFSEELAASVRLRLAEVRRNPSGIALTTES